VLGAAGAGDEGGSGGGGRRGRGGRRVGQGVRRRWGGRKRREGAAGVGELRRWCPGEVRRVRGRAPLLARLHAAADHACDAEQASPQRPAPAAVPAPRSPRCLIRAAPAPAAAQARRRPCSGRRRPAPYHPCYGSPPSSSALPLHGSPWPSHCLLLPRPHASPCAAAASWRRRSRRLPGIRVPRGTTTASTPAHRPPSRRSLLRPPPAV